MAATGVMGNVGPRDRLRQRRPQSPSIRIRPASPRADPFQNGAPPRSEPSTVATSWVRRADGERDRGRSYRGAWAGGRCIWSGLGGTGDGGTSGPCLRARGPPGERGRPGPMRTRQPPPTGQGRFSYRECARARETAGRMTGEPSRRAARSCPPRWGPRRRLSDRECRACSQRRTACSREREQASTACCELTCVGGLDAGAAPWLLQPTPTPVPAAATAAAGKGRRLQPSLPDSALLRVGRSGSPALAGAAPSVAGWRLSGLPKRLEPG